MVFSLMRPAWMKPEMQPRREIYSLAGSDRDVLLDGRFSMGIAASSRAKGKLGQKVDFARLLVGTLVAIYVSEFGDSEP
jgi:hypothetical protein